MSINGIGTNNIPYGYETKTGGGNYAAKTENFMETVAKKSAQSATNDKAAEYAGETVDKAAEHTEKVSDKAAEYAEKAFASVGAKAPEEVKKAWMDAAKEVGANGLGINERGMMTHISQMMVQRLKKSWLNGGTYDDDILGSTVSSAIASTRQALYDLENPLMPNHTESIEVQRAKLQEKAFYQAFLERLYEIQND